MRDDEGRGACKAGADGAVGALNSVSELSSELSRGCGEKPWDRELRIKWELCKLERIRAREGAALEFLSPVACRPPDGRW